MRAYTAGLAAPGLTVSFASLIAFSVGALSTATVNIVGNIYIYEIIALLWVIIVGPRRILHRNPQKSVIITGMILIFIGLLLADIRNATPTNNSLRGLANPLVAIIDILFFADLFNRSNKAFLAWLAGTVLASLLITDQSQLSVILDDSNGFKSRIAPFLVPALLIILFHATRFNKNAPSWLATIAGFAFIWLGARSDGLFFLATAAILMNTRLKRGPQRYVFGALLLVGGYIVYIGYVDAILTGGQASNSFDQLSRATNPYNPFYLLLQGRTEFFVALAAIRDAPLFGHGSWATDATGVYSQLWATIKGWTTVNYSDFIVSHSVVLTAWLWGGLIALVGTLMVYVSSARQALAVMPYLNRWRPILLFMLIQITWHFLFSPFGHIRTSFPMFIGLTLALSQSSQPDRRRR